MNKKFSAGVALMSLILASIAIPSPTHGFERADAHYQQKFFTKKYSNCSALNKDFPGGVSKSSKVKNQGGKTKYQPKVDAKIYEANKGKDRDKDGIACER